MGIRSAVISSAVLAMAAGSALGAAEVFGISGGTNRLIRYDVAANSFQDSGDLTNAFGFNTTLAIDANRRVYWMNPFEGQHTIYSGQLDGSNNLVGQGVYGTLNTSGTGIGILDGFTIGPDQNLYIAGYGKSELYRYDLIPNTGNLTTEVHLVGGGEFRSDLAFDPVDGAMVGIGIAPDGSGRRTLYTVPGGLMQNGIDDAVAWQYFGGLGGGWDTLDLRNLLGGNPDGIAFDPATGLIYLSGDGDNFSVWNRNGTLLSYITNGYGVGWDLAFAQAVPAPSVAGLLALGSAAALRRRRR
ncbi:MAG: hypothetical protein HYX51_00875 [Chloroflexi bacterium]|nr:hypothetical protein [Chloroflexota bacterium]